MIPGGLPHDVPTAYHDHTDYWGDNDTLSDYLWESLDTSPIAVAFTHNYAAKKNLPKSAGFPWDTAKSVYFLKVYHQIHCLVRYVSMKISTLLTLWQKLLRRGYLDYQRGNEQVISAHHIHHCLDALRQDLMCQADDTPMPAFPAHIGNNQIRQCRDWEKFVAWTQQPEHSSCYRTFDYYRPMYHGIEHYAFCPKYSPYNDIMHASFEKHGHQDPFVE